MFKIFLIFLKLGCISFGGPIAHLGYFRDEFVHRLKWLSDHAYADLVALCLLPTRMDQCDFFAKRLSPSDNSLSYVAVLAHSGLDCCSFLRLYGVLTFILTFF